MTKINLKTGKMEKFIEKFILPKLTQNKLQSLNSLITFKETESKKKLKSSKENTSSNAFIGKFYQRFKKLIISILHKLFQKIEWVSGTHPMRPLKPCIKIRPGKYEGKKTYQSIPWTYAKYSRQNISKWIQECISDICRDPTVFMPEV